MPTIFRGLRLEALSAKRWSMLPLGKSWILEHNREIISRELKQDGKWTRRLIGLAHKGERCSWNLLKFALCPVVLFYLTLEGWNKRKCLQDKSITPIGLIWDTNMAAVTSREIPFNLISQSWLLGIFDLASLREEVSPLIRKITGIIGRRETTTVVFRINKNLKG